MPRSCASTAASGSSPNRPAGGHEARRPSPAPGPRDHEQGRAGARTGIGYRAGRAGVADEVLIEIDGGIAVITINRPQARNAVNGVVSAGIAAAVEDLDARRDVRVLILTGAGGTFSAGMDLKGFLTGDNPLAGGRGFGGITERPPAKPVIAAVEGYALAGGFEL